MPATYEDVKNAPDNKVAEILDGTLHLSPRPAPRHALAATRLSTLLVDPFDRGRGGPGGWWILIEPEIHIGPHVVVPDIGGWRRERMSALPEEPFFSVIPDWVCEVLSPSTERIDRSSKLRIYAEAGVAHVWLVSPIHRTLEVLRRHDVSWVIDRVITADDPVRVEPFDALALEVAALWPEAGEG
jgi:Uma2 family endonuclease